ncbi:MAG: hypothetical protein HS127_07860 [Planctomycetia bacterium]|uniref:hypothetical protein n=1 Tax=Candidatus Kuenenia sp. TaxID=2499824 RepID=UPI001DAF68DA|nr:hypothetical protein [Planctomycetia bacterium]
MSWLNIRGKMYHCLKCSEIVKVEYKGGACLTQIGDNRLYEQTALTKRYGQPTANPNTEGYYLHNEIICEPCFKKRYMKSGQHDVAMNMEALCNRLSGIKDKYAENVGRATEAAFNNWLENISHGNLREISTSAFDKTIGLKIFKLRNKRKDLVGQFVSSAKDSIIASILNQINSDPCLRDATRQYASEAQPIVDSIRKLLTNLKGKFFHKGEIFRVHRINLPENLNDYVLYEMTTRTPATSTPDITVFYQTNMRKKDITEFLNSCDSSNQVEMDEDKLIGKLKKRLEALASI